MITLLTGTTGSNVLKLSTTRPTLRYTIIIKRNTKFPIRIICKIFTLEIQRSLKLESRRYYAYDSRLHSSPTFKVEKGVDL